MARADAAVPFSDDEDEEPKIRENGREAVDLKRCSYVDCCRGEGEDVVEDALLVENIFCVFPSIYPFSFPVTAAAAV